MPTRHGKPSIDSTVCSSRLCVTGAEIVPGRTDFNMRDVWGV